MGLAKALRAYDGAILLVSHDRHFVRCVIEGASLLPPSDSAEDDDGLGDEESDDGEDGETVSKRGTVYQVGPKGKVQVLKGGVNDYVAKVERRLKKEFGQ